MKLKIKCTNVYAGEEIVNVQDVDVPAPDSDFTNDELEDWGMEELMQFTGTGRTSGHAGYFVEVLECAERPELVGFEVSAEG